MGRTKPLIPLWGINFEEAHMVSLSPAARTILT